MTTDTAVRVTRRVVQNRGESGLCLKSPDVLTTLTLVSLDAIPYVDHPEIRVDAHESTEMPFRYIAGSSGKPIMPPVSLP